MTVSNKILIETNKGEIIILLYPELAPGTVNNFKSFVNQGIYNGVLFHRAEENFIVQTGDPLTKDPEKKELWGSGGKEFKLLGDSDPKPNPLKHRPGAVVVADSDNSQFYIVLTRKTTKHLDGKYMVFAQVVKGMDKINKIEVGDKINKISILPGL